MATILVMVWGRTDGIRRADVRSLAWHDPSRHRGPRYLALTQVQSRVPLKGRRKARGRSRQAPRPRRYGHDRLLDIWRPGPLRAPRRAAPEYEAAGEGPRRRVPSFPERPLPTASAPRGRHLRRRVRRPRFTAPRATSRAISKAPCWSPTCPSAADRADGWYAIDAAPRLRRISRLIVDGGRPSWTAMPRMLTRRSSPSAMEIRSASDRKQAATGWAGRTASDAPSCGLPRQRGMPPRCSHPASSGEGTEPADPSAAGRWEISGSGEPAPSAAPIGSGVATTAGTQGTSRWPLKLIAWPGMSAISHYDCIRPSPMLCFDHGGQDIRRSTERHL